MGTIELTHIAANVAIENGLPPQIVLAVCQVESSWNPLAMRYEPGYRWLELTAPHPALISPATETAGQMTSWGLMQIMGANARHYGFRGWFPELCADPAQGLKYGCLMLADLARRHLAKENGWRGVVSAWNDGNPRIDPGETYWKKILDALGGAWPK